MREIDLYRKHFRRFVQRETGRNPGPLAGSIHFHGEQKNLLGDTDLARMPETSDTTSTIQGPGGGWAFMVDVTPIDSPTEPIL